MELTEDEKIELRNEKRYRNFAIALLAIGVLWLVFGNAFVNWITTLFVSKTFNEQGDAFGGITGPVINFISVILLYLSFDQQIKANRIQRKALNHDRDLNIRLKNYEIIDKQIDDLTKAINDATLHSAERGTLTFKTQLRVIVGKTAEITPTSTQVDYFFNDLSYLIFQTALVYENFDKHNKLLLQPEHRETLKLKLDALFAKHYTGDINEKLQFPTLFAVVDKIEDSKFREQVKTFLNNLLNAYLLYQKDNSFRSRNK